MGIFMMRHRAVYLWLASSVTVSVMTGAAHAQTIPSSADPVKAAERFQNDPFTKPSEDPFSSIAGTRNNEAVGEEKFVLGGVKINGLSVYNQESFAEIYSAFIGKPISVNQAKAIASEIGRRYQNAGYALAVAYVPTQNVDDGSTLQIQVDEGYIGKVTFQGDQPSESTVNLLNRHIEKIRSDKPVKTDTLERYLLLINDIPGNTARAVLKPSVSIPGATDLVIYYVHKPYEVAASTDNRGSRFLGPWQHSLSFATNSALGLDERITLRTITSSPTNELRYLDVQYDQPINTNGTMISTMVSGAKTNPGESLRSSNVESDSLNAKLRLIHPLLRSRLENLVARGAFELRNSKTDIRKANFTDDRIRSVLIGGSYDFASESSATIVDAEITKGISGLGSTDDGAGRSNPRADHNFIKFTLDASRNQMLYDNISLLLSGSGQYALNPLLNSEQFQLGGPAYGTAYDPGEFVGDHGVAGKIELRYNDALNDPLVKSFQLYSFYDIGTVWRKKTTLTQKNRSSLASAGVGVRLSLNEDISTNLEYAIPLTHDLLADRDNSGRIYAGMSARY